jgi:hypothetical protein
MHDLTTSRHASTSLATFPRFFCAYLSPEDIYKDRRQIIAGNSYDRRHYFTINFAGRFAASLLILHCACPPAELNLKTNTLRKELSIF